MTNGASNVIKLIQLRDQCKPSGLVWGQFDYDDVGKKTDKKIEIFMVRVLRVRGHQ